MFTIMQISLWKVHFAQMNVFSHYCLTFSANDCVFSLNEQQKVYLHQALYASIFYSASDLFAGGNQP